MNKEEMAREIHDLAQEAFQLERDLEQAKKDIDLILSRHENDAIRCRFCIHRNPKTGKCVWDDCLFEYGHRSEKDYGDLPFENTDASV